MVPQEEEWLALPPPPPPPGPPPRKPMHLTINVGSPPPPPPGKPKLSLSANLSLNTAASTEPSLKSGASIVEERRRAAMAMYESTEGMEEHQESLSSPQSIVLISSDKYAVPIHPSPVPLMPIDNLINKNLSRDKTLKKDNMNLSEPAIVPSTADLPTATISTAKTISSPLATTANTFVASTPPIATATPTGKSPRSLNSRSDGKAKKSGAPDSKEKRGFFKKILGGRIKDKPSPSPAKTPKQIKRGKKNTPNLGRPQNAKPGSSYMSTPHSAEIVVRKPIEMSQHLTTPNLIVTPEAVQAPFMIVSTHFEEENQLEMMESFSPPQFNNNKRNQEEEEQDYPKIETKRRFIPTDDSIHLDDISAMTEPTVDVLTPQKLQRTHPQQMQALYEEEPAADPFGHYWDGSKTSRTKFDVDPFEDPFFKEMEKNMPLSPCSQVIPDPPLTFLDHSLDDSEGDPGLISILATPSSPVELDVWSGDSPILPAPRSTSPMARLEIRYIEQALIDRSQARRSRLSLKDESAAMVQNINFGENEITKALERNETHQVQVLNRLLSNDCTVESHRTPLKESKSFIPSRGATQDGQHISAQVETEMEHIENSLIIKRRLSVDEIMRKKKEHRESHNEQSTYRRLSNERLIDRPQSSQESSVSLSNRSVEFESGGIYESETLQMNRRASSRESEGSATTAKAIAYIRNKGSRRSPVRYHSNRSESDVGTSGSTTILVGLPQTPTRPSMGKTSPPKVPKSTDSPRTTVSKFSKQGRKPSKTTTRSSTTQPKARIATSPSRDSTLNNARLGQGNLNNAFPGQGNLDNARPGQGNLDNARPGQGNLNNVRPGKANKPSSPPCQVSAPPIPNKKSPRLLIDHKSVVYGVSLQARKRQILIDHGEAVRAVPALKQMKPQKSSAALVSEADMDPIQRAGFRLLSKAAVPIQSGIRRYFGQKVAVDRMWAIIELQSYFRRWRCCAFLLAHVTSATVITAAFRGWKSRDIIDEKQYCAIEIQRTFRGYLAACKVYDDIYRVVVIQSCLRRLIGQKKCTHRLQCIVMIQSCYRSYQSKQLIEKYHTSATTIQSLYRSYSAQLHFQFDVVDIIIVQSLVRRRGGQKRAHQMENDLRHESATKIQGSWRGFQAYTDFIFSIADILVVQRTLRRRLATRQVQSMREAKAVTVIQSNWRRYNVQMSVLYKLVHIIIVQSVIRRHQASIKTKLLRVTMWSEETASVKIQAAWRKFWQYSHYLILQYEIVRVQALFRGHSSRKAARLQLGCAIIIQSSIRKLLAMKRIDEHKVSMILVNVASVGMREYIASRKIIRGWRYYELLRRRRLAARKIEKFFLRVKEEVDREVRRQERKKASKKKRQKKENDEKLLERVWLNTVVEDVRPAQDQKTNRSKSLPRGGTDRVEDTRWRRVHEYDNGYGNVATNRDPNGPPTSTVSIRHADDISELSAPSVFNRQASVPSRYTTLSRKEMSDDLSLEEAWIDTEIHQVKERRRTEDEYMHRNGLQYHNSFHRHPDSRQHFASGHMKRGDQRHQHDTFRHQPTSFSASAKRDQSPRLKLRGESSRHQAFDAVTRKFVDPRVTTTQKYYSSEEMKANHKVFHESPSRRQAGVHNGSGGEMYHYPEQLHSSSHTMAYTSDDAPFLHTRAPAGTRVRGRKVSREMHTGDYALHVKDLRTGYFLA